jgi:geranylgeranyl pyrophosphate synthase
LGPAFQIRDDLIDLTQGKGRGGEIGCDIKEGKPSIFFAYVLDREQGTDDDRARLVEIVGKPREETGIDDVSWVIDLYKRAGAVEFAQNEAQALIQQSQEVIETLPLDDSGKQVFRAIAKFMIDRTT